MAGNSASAIDILPTTPLLNRFGFRLPVIIRIGAEQRFPVGQFFNAAPESVLGILLSLAQFFVPVN